MTDFVYMYNQLEACWFIIETVPYLKAPGIMLDIHISNLGMIS